MAPNWIAIFFVFTGFISGSVMYALLLSKVFLKKDARDFGDGNPGTVNAFKAGGFWSGLLTLVLDFSKGFLPTLFAVYFFNVSDYWLIPVGLAPILGHAFSPFLRFNGGKAVAVTYGCWAGLTLGEGALALGIMMAIIFLLTGSDVWPVIIGISGLIIYLFFRGFSMLIILTALGNLGVLMIKYRHELKQPFRLKAIITRFLRLAK